MRLEVPQRIRGPRLDARGAERPSHPRAVQPGPPRKERLVRNDPRHAELRVVHGVEVLTEGAVLIGAQASGDEQAALEPELLLHERAERDRLVGRFIGLGGRPGGDRRAPGRQVLRVRPVAVEHVLDVLDAGRGARRERRAQHERRGGICVRRVVEKHGPVVGLEPRNGTRADRRALVAPAQVGIHPVREVDPTDHADPQPALGPPVRRAAPDEAVDVLIHSLREELIRCVQAVAEQRHVVWREQVPLESRPAEPVGQEADRVVVGLRQPLRAGDESGLHREVDLRREVRLHVGAHVRAAARVGPVLLVGHRVDLPCSDEAAPGEVRHPQHPPLILPLPGHEVASDIGPAGYLQSILLPVPRAQRRGVGILEQVERGDAVLLAVLWVGSGANGLREKTLSTIARRGSSGPRAVGDRIVVVVLDNPRLGEHVEPGRSRRAALRLDDDHPVRRGRTVQGRSGRTLHDIVRLDLVGVDVVDPARVRAADADARGVVGALHPDTVDHIDRLVVERQAARAPDAHPRTGAGDVSREHLDARHPRAQQVVHVGNRARLHEAVGPDGRDGVGSLLSCLVARDRGHHGVECIRRELEREVGGRSFARGDSQAASRRGIADERRPHGYGAGGNVAERVAPLGVARRHERRSLDGDAGARERMAGRLVGYLAGDAALLGAGGCSDAPDQGAEPQQRETRSTMRGAHTSSPFRAGQRLRKPLARMQPRRRGRVIVQLTLQRRKGPYLEKSTFGACAAPGVCSSKYGRGPLPMTFAVSTWGKRRMYAL